MPKATLSQLINRPVAEVFATVSDLTTFPSWNPTTKSASLISEGEIGEGTVFQMSVKGFGNQVMELTEFEKDKQVRLIPRSKMSHGGHRFVFSTEDDKTRIDHELEMYPKGVFVIFSPLMGMMSRRNLKQTAQALQDYLERR